MDRTAATAIATVAMAATAADRTAVDSMATAKARTVATVAATDDSACCTRHRRRVSNCQEGGDRRAAGSLGRHRAGRQTGRGSPANLRGSVLLVMLVARAHCRGLQMLSRSLCLWPGTPVAVKRVRCRVRWCAGVEGSGWRASGAGRAEGQGIAHLRGTFFHCLSPFTRNACKREVGSDPRILAQVIFFNEVPCPPARIACASRSEGGL